MKRVICIILTLMFIAAFAGCKGNKNEVTEVGAATPIPSQKVKNNDNNNDGDSITKSNTVVFTNGRLDGTDYYWKFFLNKVKSKFAGSITVEITEGEENYAYEIKYSKGVFTLDDGNEIKKFSQLITFEEVDAGGYSVSLGILTNDEGLTLTNYFGGPVPDDVKVGYSNEMGVVVFADFN